MDSQHNTSCVCDSHKEKHELNFKVDAEALKAYSDHEVAELTVREILDMAGNQPANDYYLIEFIGDGCTNRKEFKDLDERLKVREHARFAAIYRGCTPVS